MEEKEFSQLVDMALTEDIGSGDVTSEILIPKDFQGEACLIAKQPLVVCGHQVVREVFLRVDSDVSYQVLVKDGVEAEPSDKLARIKGPLRAILTAERTALNFMQRMSGIATRTSGFVAKTRGKSVDVLDTRKTTPGWRVLEKYAVKVGGGVNHRRGLFDAVLIKNNHLDALGGDVGSAVNKARKVVGRSLMVEVEVRSPKELQEALNAEPDVIMLDNMSPFEVAACLKIISKKPVSLRPKIEVSGGIDLNNIGDYLLPGVQRISIGGLTHSAPAVDISLRYQNE